MRTFPRPSRSLISNDDGTWRFKKMEYSVQRIRSMNIDLLRLRIETLETGFLSVLVIEIEQYGIESLGSDPSG
jgi:hypothetical protein